MSVTVASRTVVALVCAFVVASATTAFAESAADAAFKRGRELLKAGKYADACIEFEHSQKLDPALGTEFNIAQCSEKIGKLARALELYRGLLPRDTNAERKRIVADAIPKLEARVPKLLVRVPTPPPSGFTMTIQGKNSVVPPRRLVANTPVEMDLGEYEIVAQATNHPDWRHDVRIDTEGKTTTVDAPFAAPRPTVPTEPTPSTTTPATTPLPAAEPTNDPDDPEPAPAPRSRRKLYGVISLGVGGAALVGGVVFGAMARSKWSEAKDVCGGTTCTTQAHVMRANELGDDARSKATLSTIFVLAGTAAAATGVVLWLTAPSSESATQVTAHPTTGGAGITLSGRF